MKTPKGILIAIGGKEARSTQDDTAQADKAQVTFTNEGVLQEVLGCMKGTRSRIEVITTASQEPDEMGQMYVEAFGQLGCEQVNVLNLDGRNVDAKKTLEALQGADGVFFSGGDQTRLLDKLGGSEFMKLLTKRYMEEPFVIAGTSAGAMAMSSIMIREGSSTESLLKGIVEIQEGFGLLPNTVIDTHFMSRGRFSRLIETILMKNGSTALGICEDTGLVIREGNLLHTIGSGGALVVQADNVSQTNFKEAGKMQAVFVEGLSVHILAKGAAYDLKNKEFIVEEKSRLT